MDKVELKNRTKAFSVRVLKMVDSLPKSVSGYELAKQVVRSGCSVGANYRAAIRAKSKADFNNKINIVLEEADETLFWMELIAEAGLLKANKLNLLMQETEELIRIFAATLKTARANA